jgi:hypothetical protein
METMNNKQIILLIVLVGIAIATALLAYPTQCPYVDESGMPCMGTVMPSTPIPGHGQAYECSNGHRWVETN